MNKKTAQSKTGPKEQRLVIKGNWKDAVKVALGKTRPAEGWPEPPEKKKRSAAKPK